MQTENGLSQSDILIRRNDYLPRVLEAGNEPILILVNPHTGFVSPETRGRTEPGPGIIVIQRRTPSSFEVRCRPVEL